MKPSVQHFRRATPVALVLAAVLGIAGCTTSGLETGPKYETSREVDDLEIPPDLTATGTRDTYRIPDAPGERVSAREMQEGADTRPQRSATTQLNGPGDTDSRILPETSDVQLMREGDVRWLEVEAEPEQLWDRLVQFWDLQNLRLERNEPRIGIMETVWAENRAGIPLSTSQNLFARAFSNIYDANTRDKFRLRVERNNGGSAIYISHLGAEEEAEGDAEGRVFRWTMRPSDPELEAEMLNRLLVYLTTGESPEGGQRIAETVADRPTRVREAEHDGSPVLIVAGEVERLWPVMGTYLDRAGLLVDEQDRRNRIFEVTYRPDMTGEEDNEGFFSRIFGGEDARTNERYQVRLNDAGEGEVRVEPRAIDGAALHPDDAEFVLEQIKQQILR